MTKNSKSIYLANISNSKSIHEFSVGQAVIARSYNSKELLLPGIRRPKARASFIFSPDWERKLEKGILNQLCIRVVNYMTAYNFLMMELEMSKARTSRPIKVKPHRNLCLQPRKFQGTSLRSRSRPSRHLTTSVTESPPLSGEECYIMWTVYVFLISWLSCGSFITFGFVVRSVFYLILY